MAGELLWKDDALVWENDALLVLDDEGRADCCCPQSSSGVDDGGCCLNTYPTREDWPDELYSTVISDCLFTVPSPVLEKQDAISTGDAAVYYSGGESGDFGGGVAISLQLGCGGSYTGSINPFSTPSEEYLGWWLIISGPVLDADGNYHGFVSCAIKLEPSGINGPPTTVECSPFYISISWPHCTGTFYHSGSGPNLWECNLTELTITL